MIKFHLRDDGQAPVRVAVVVRGRGSEKRFGDLDAAPRRLKEFSGHLEAVFVVMVLARDDQLVAVTPLPGGVFLRWFLHLHPQRVGGVGLDRRVQWVR